MACTLFTYPNNFRAYKALIVAQYSAVSMKMAPEFVFGETNCCTEFLQKFPLGKVPALETADGKFLMESNAIAYYVANEQLRGVNEFDRSEVLSYLFFADNELLPAVQSWVLPIIGIVQYNKKNVEIAKTHLRQALGALNERLLSRTFLVSECITLADIVVFATLLSAYENVMDPGFRAPFRAVTRWFTTMVNQPQVKAVVQRVSLCAKVAEYDANKCVQMTAIITAREAKHKNKKNDKKLAKEELQQEKLEEDWDKLMGLAPKSKDPFDVLPKGTFNLEDFKRFYSNEEVSKSIPYFWKNFDSKHYSIWYSEYKYPEELTKMFMSCNLITGMFQRLEKMRKQAFASVCVFGEDDNSSISGIWIWLGQELAFLLSPDWQVDYEVYDWKKLDPGTEPTQKLVAQYLAWTGTDKAGRTLIQAKIFK